MSDWNWNSHVQHQGLEGSQGCSRGLMLKRNVSDTTQHISWTHLLSTSQHGLFVLIYAYLIFSCLDLFDVLACYVDPRWTVMYKLKLPSCHRAQRNTKVRPAQAGSSDLKVQTSSTAPWVALGGGWCWSFSHTFLWFVSDGKTPVKHRTLTTSWYNL